ncbi:hypothetical protein AJ80_04893 [Polytolypa hystricis UAMH7299]|uniref:Mitochondrial cytochrome c oxidase assembly factor n=1 Tax=Polytolypa hystricis (strain UAMH7299) TaxID=1447883 RepID=A0A2B7Y867_POLH7|nr:hypothetical protein AJ80_04893 [Polytolypa hystricis UAMH7299]
MLNSMLRRLQGGNLEVLKFGMYILFPISWMYYFGTNLEERFTISEFWPTKEQSHKIPLELGDIEKELARMNREKELRRLKLKEAQQQQQGGESGATS